MNWQRVALIFAVLLVGLWAVRGCVLRTRLLTVTPTQVAQLPEQYANRRVALSGQVTCAFSLGQSGFYLLQDDEGSALTVLAAQEPPSVGAIVRVTGIVRKALQIGAASVVGVEELSRTVIGKAPLKVKQQVITLKDLADNALKFNGRPVIVQGKVAEAADILGTGYYVLIDDGERLTVITGAGAPRVGTMVQVLGVYYRLAQVGRDTMACLVELEKK
ncbi:MAG: hypothetical protein KEFWMYNX_001132 [Candidatus Fervidibacter sp.]|jgi:hypothetical protein